MLGCHEDENEITLIKLSVLNQRGATETQIGIINIISYPNGDWLKCHYLIKRPKPIFKVIMGGLG